MPKWLRTVRQAYSVSLGVVAVWSVIGWCFSPSIATFSLPLLEVFLGFMGPGIRSWVRFSKVIGVRMVLALVKEAPARTNAISARVYELAVGVFEVFGMICF